MFIKKSLRVYQVYLPHEGLVALSQVWLISAVYRELSISEEGPVIALSASGFNMKSSHKKSTSKSPCELD